MPPWQQILCAPNRTQQRPLFLACCREQGSFSFPISRCVERCPLFFTTVILTKEKWNIILWGKQSFDHPFFLYWASSISAKGTGAAIQDAEVFINKLRTTFRKKCPLPQAISIPQTVLYYGLVYPCLSPGRLVNFEYLMYENLRCICWHQVQAMHVIAPKTIKALSNNVCSSKIDCRIDASHSIFSRHPCDGTVALPRYKERRCIPYQQHLLPGLRKPSHKCGKNDHLSFK